MLNILLEQHNLFWLPALNSQYDCFQSWEWINNWLCFYIRIDENARTLFSLWFKKVYNGCEKFIDYLLIMIKQKNVILEKNVANLTTWHANQHKTCQFVIYYL